MKKLFRLKSNICKLRKKIESKKGESITEVLVASLVIAFGSILLASMVVASTSIIKKSIIAYGQYISFHNEAEMLDADETSGGTPGSISFYGRMHEYGTGDLNHTPYKISDMHPYQESVSLYNIQEDGENSRFSFLKYFSTGTDT